MNKIWTKYKINCVAGDTTSEIRPSVIVSAGLNAHQRDSKEFNIVLFGERGAGKTTWINAFANYMKYSSLEEAEANERLVLIPMSFKWSEETYVQREITVGDRSQSASQPHLNTFCLRCDDVIIRLIDTPFMDDLRGEEFDKSNVDNALKYVSQFSELNCICFLMKSNQTRLGIWYQCYFQELLSHLSEAFCNIIFCFTDSRGTFFRPGDTMSSLKRLVNQLAIPLNLNNIYCVDNESIRYLYATKAGVSCRKYDKKLHEESWTRSSNEMERMLQYVASLNPCKLVKSTSTNERWAVRTVVAMSRITVERNHYIELKNM